MLMLLAACIVMALSALYFYQHRIIFYPEYTPADKALRIGGEPIEECFLDVDSATRVHYVVFPKPDAKGVILFFHGNAGNLEHWGEVAEELSVHLHQEVWIMDYPGFGKSVGDLPRSEKILLQMGQKFIETIRAERPGLKLSLFGRSIGTGPASELSLTHSIDALVLVTPYTTFKALARDHFKWVPPFMIHYDMGSERMAESEPKFPILIVHGTIDETIPYRHAEELVSKLGRRANFVTIPNGRHNSLSDHAEYWPALEKFFKSSGLN